jgi:hypothetical protein
MRQDQDLRDESAYPRDSCEYVKVNREERFKVKELANGTSIVRAEVKFIDSERPLLLTDSSIFVQMGRKSEAIVRKVAIP